MEENVKAIKIRPVKIEDSSALLQIYAPYVKETAITLEYDIPSEEEFASRINEISKKFPYLVLCKNEKPIGYAYASTFHARAAYDKSVELSIYIEKSMHGQGYGRLLYSKLEEELKKSGFAQMYACIAATSRSPDSNLTDASIKFHEKLGFTNAGYFKNCAIKFGRWYNMVYMQKNLLTEYKDEIPSDNNIEVIDIYDNQKKVTGKTIARTELFTNDNLLRSIIHVCIFNSKNELLIQKRASVKKTGAGMWDFSASGQVLAGESAQTGAIREIKEELGLSFEISDPPIITKIFFNSYNDYFFVRADFDITDVILQKEEVESVKWASRKEVLSLHGKEKFLSYPKSLIELIFDVGEHKD